MKVVDLFSGCGGFSYGFHLADLEDLCIDNWTTARDSIYLNHGQEPCNIKLSEKHKYDIEKYQKPENEFNDVIPDSEITQASSLRLFFKF